MYRPNRIGPSGLVHLDLVPKAYGTLGATFRNAETLFSAALPDTTVRVDTVSRHFNGQIGSLTLGQQHSVGVAINGAHPQSEDSADDFGYHLTISGAIRVRQGAALMGAVPQMVLGRADGALASPGPNACTNYMMVPGVSGGVSVTAAFASVNTTILVGDYDGSWVYDSAALIAMWVMQNANASTVTLDYAGSISMHKWNKDIDTFDPVRT